ncbi:MAG: ribosomal protein S18-alanine N-acetyltransferase [candidate division WOR-3 bacterium]
MIIGIDCSSKEGGIATSPNVFYPIEIVEDIPFKLKDLNIKSEDIEKVLITYGPGSFTSLRVGLVIAQGIALPKNTPILGYSTFYAMIEGIPEGDLFPLIPLRSEVVYAAYFKKKGGKIEEIFKDKIIRVEDLIIYLKSNSISSPIIFGKGAEENKAILEKNGFRIYLCSFSIACNLFSLYNRNAEFVENPLTPLYISEPGAIKKRSIAEIKIREMKEEDLEKILEIERSVFKDPWPYEVFYTRFYSDFCIKLVGEFSGEIVGYLFGSKEKNKFHLENFAIEKKHWRKGFGTKLLTYLLDELSKNPEINSCYLEHRIQNKAAFEFYKKLGFTFKGIKKGYYGEKEDAVIMEIKF